MYRDYDPVYKASLGYPVDAEERAFDIESGTSGYTEPLDRENGFELSADDLYIEAHEVVAIDPREARIQEINFEIYTLSFEVEPTDQSIEDMLLLEVEKTMLAEEIAYELVSNNPIDTERLMNELTKLDTERAEGVKDYLVTSLMEHGENGAPVDAEMYNEAAILGQYIADANPETTSEGLVAIAEAMQAAIAARSELNHVLAA